MLLWSITKHIVMFELLSSLFTRRRTFCFWFSLVPFLFVREKYVGRAEDSKSTWGKLDQYSSNVCFSLHNSSLCGTEAHTETYMYTSVQLINARFCSDIQKVRACQLSSMAGAIYSEEYSTVQIAAAAFCSKEYSFI